MPSHLVANYLPRASQIRNEDQLFSFLAQEYSPFPSIHTCSAAINNKPLPESTTEISSQSEHTLLPRMTSIPFSHSQWTAAQEETSIFNGSFQSLPHQYFYCPQDKVPPEQNPNGKLLHNVQWLRGSAHDQVSPSSSMTCQREFPEQVNEDVKVAVGTVSQNNVPTRRGAFTACFTESVNHDPHSSSFSPRYRPLSSDIYRTSSSMDTLYPAIDLFPNYPLTFESTPVDATGVENYSATSPFVTYPTSPAIASTMDNDEDSDEGLSSEPYAQLIYRALKSVPSHRMVLKEIYDWFEKNTDKAKNNTSKGWQNSIRHNLSMNGVSHPPQSAIFVNTE